MEVISAFTDYLSISLSGKDSFIRRNRNRRGFASNYLLLGMLVTTEKVGE